MTLDANAPAPAPLPALTKDQLDIAQLALIVLGNTDGKRAADVVAVYDEPTGPALIDAAKELRARLAQSEQHIEQVYITLSSMGL